MFPLTGAEALRDTEGRATMPAVIGRAGDPVAEIEERIAAGEISPETVERARAYWREHLQAGVDLPNGETATITWRGFHHVMRDSRIREQPALVTRILNHIDEIRTADGDRRRALSHWRDVDGPHWGYGILSSTGHVITMHYTRERAVKRFRQQGSQLWIR